LLGNLATLEAARPSIGDVVVLDLGYNDGADPTAWRDRLDRAAAILDGVPKVIWLAQREFAEGRAEMNAELRDVAQLHPNIEVVDWNAIVAAHPDYVYGDGIHLTPAGQAGMAQVVRERVDAFVAARVAATSTTVATTTTTTTTTSAAPRAGRSSRTRGSANASDGEGDALWLVPLAGVALLAVAIAIRLRSRPGRVPRRAE
jgi:hypothetical protein